MIKRVGVRWRIVGLLAAVLVSVALPYFITRSSSEQALSSRDWVTHTADIKASIYRADAILRSSEAAVYTLAAGGTLDKDLEERALMPETRLPGVLATLRETVADNPDQVARIGGLETVANGRLKLTKEALEKIRAGDRAGAFAIMEDARQMFPFRERVVDILAEETKLQEERRANARGTATDNRVVLGVAALAQIALLVIVVVVSERQIAIRLAAESKVDEAVKRSQLIVQAVREPIALLDSELRALLVNTAFAELYGYDAEDEQAHMPLRSLGNGAWDDMALLQRLNDVLARDRELWDYELTQRTVDGIDRFVVINAR
jgi:PAS domain-containing protein